MGKDKNVGVGRGGVVIMSTQIPNQKASEQRSKQADIRQGKL